MVKSDRIEPGARTLSQREIESKYTPERLDWFFGRCYHVPGWERMLWPLGPSKVTLQQLNAGLEEEREWRVGPYVETDDPIKDLQDRLRRPTE